MSRETNNVLPLDTSECISLYFYWSKFITRVQGKNRWSDKAWREKSNTINVVNFVQLICFILLCKETLKRECHCCFGLQNTISGSVKFPSFSFNIQALWPLYTETSMHGSIRPHHYILGWVSAFKCDELSALKHLWVSSTTPEKGAKSTIKIDSLFDA